MKPHVITAFLCILVFTSCLPNATNKEDGKRSIVTQTNTLTPDKPIAPTETDVNTSTVTQMATPIPPKTVTPTPTESGLFEISKDYMIFQQGNTAPASLLIVKPSQELVDNHIGLWYETYDRYSDRDSVYSNGFKRIRIGGLFGSNQTLWPIRESTLSTEVDEVISEYAENDIIIMLVNSTGSGLGFPMQEFTQNDIDIFLKYIAFVATHFKGRIPYYEIYNEFGNTPKVHTYANLVEQSVALIKEIDPDAKVIFGSVPGDTLKGEEGYGEHYRFVMNTNYMWALIDAIDFNQIDVDGISWHPIYDPIPEDPYYQNYPQMVQEIRHGHLQRASPENILLTNYCGIPGMNPIIVTGHRSAKSLQPNIIFEPLLNIGDWMSM